MKVDHFLCDVCGSTLIPNGDQDVYPQPFKLFIAVAKKNDGTVIPALNLDIKDVCMLCRKKLHKALGDVPTILSTINKA